jgi:low temperature requirement protein LtrA
LNCSSISFSCSPSRWWAYFDRQQEAMEAALREADAQETGRLACDVYLLLHYSMIVGIVVYAVALQEVVVLVIAMGCIGAMKIMGNEEVTQGVRLGNASLRVPKRLARSW